MTAARSTTAPEQFAASAQFPTHLQPVASGPTPASTWLADSTPSAPSPESAAGGLVSAQAVARASYAARALCEHLTTLAVGMHAATSAFPGGPEGWHGPAAEVLSSLLAAEPQRFQAVATACSSASSALAGYADGLDAAAWLQNQAEYSGPELVADLRRRATALTDSSARQAAGTLLTLARSAPPRANLLHRWLGRVRSWRSEVLLGAAESTEQLAGTAAEISLRAQEPYPPTDIGDLKRLVEGLAADVRHPGRTGAAMIDWDTWRTDPARAVGHLVPDLALSLATGGAAAGGRTAETLRRGQAAFRSAAARAAARREATTAAAAAARDDLVRRSLEPAEPIAPTQPAEPIEPTEPGGQRPWVRPAGSTEPMHPAAPAPQVRPDPAEQPTSTGSTPASRSEPATPDIEEPRSEPDFAPGSRAGSGSGRDGSTPWHGPGGSRLTGPDNAGAERFHRLNSAAEPPVTAALRDISRTTRTELAGLGQRLKELDSFKRKLATEQADTGRPLPALLAEANDTMRYTVVIDDASYTRAVPRVGAQLHDRGFHLASAPKNAWHSGRYRGINTRWQDPRTGAAFEVQFHTPASWRITKETHGMYETARLPDTAPELAEQLRARIAEAYRAAPPPLGVEQLTGPSALLPPVIPDPFVPPTVYTVHAASTAAALLTTAATTAADQVPTVEPGSRPRG